MTLTLIRLSDNELTSGALEPATRLIARQVFASKGVLAIENAFAPELIVSLKNALMTDYARCLVDRETDETLKVGDKRIMVPVEVIGLFNTPHLYANPFVFSLVRDILDEKCVLGSFGAVIALPGAENQHIHRDHPFLFHEEAIDTLMPAYAITAIVPLVDVDKYHGTTRVWPGSHRVWPEDEARQLPSEDPVVQVGSCILMDYRLVHAGTANHSEQVRPILYLVYHRPWFKDCVNFLKIRELRVPVEERASIPVGYQSWFSVH
jgi:ectoine hydroxylase-related dioxygenase (phytanoyl-CoA dioxygenase family)